MPCVPDFLIVPLITAFVVAVSLSLLSFFVVLKRWAFLSVGVSHAAFGGIALGVLIGVSPEFTALGFGVVAAFLIAYFKRKGGFHEDITVGVLFSFFMAVGVVLFALSKSYITNAFSYLFGNLLMVSGGDFSFSVALLLVDCLFLWLKKRELLLLMMDEDMAYVYGVNVDFLYYALVFLVTINVVVAIKLVGVILVTALVVVPASVALKIAHRFWWVIFWSVFFGVVSTFSGITASLLWDLPPGATIALFCGILFFVSVLKRY